MSDLFQGQTMTEAYKFISAGTAHTFAFNFQPDKVVFNNLTNWTATDGNIVRSTWFRGQTDPAYTYQEISIDGAGTGFNFATTTTNGFTVADTSGGQDSMHATISGITKADPCVITHSAYTFQTNQIVRITDLGQVTPTTNRGMGELDNKRFMIVVLSPTTFSLKDVITGEPIDSSSFTTYVSGGRITLESAVISLNNPQVYPYSNTNPYDPNPYNYKPVIYQLTAGTSVMGADGDEYLIEVYKWGQVTDLGDLVT